MWPDLIQKAKEGGLDVIQTYVFWNGHEPEPGKVNHEGRKKKKRILVVLSKIENILKHFSLLPQYYFEGRYDLVKFIKLVKQAGLYVHLRIGPYACAEWNFG